MKIMRNLVYIIPFCLFVACNPGKRQLTYEEEMALEQLREDSIFKNRRISIQDSLSKIEGDTIISGIYFGMTEAEYQKAIAKLKQETGGVIQIGSKEYKEMDAEFDNGKLYSFSLSCTYNTDNKYSKKLDECEFDRTDEAIRIEAFEHFRNKYGDPDWCYKTSNRERYGFHRTDTCSLGEADGMMWKLNYKYIRAEQQLEDCFVYSKTKDLIFYYKFIISFFKPNIYNRLEAESDSIDKVESEKYQKELEEKHNRQTKYTNQL